MATMPAAPAGRLCCNLRAAAHLRRISDAMHSRPTLSATGTVPVLNIDARKRASFDASRPCAGSRILSSIGSVSSHALHDMIV